MKRVKVFYTGLLCLFIMFISCSNPSLKEYLDYWSGTVRVGRVEVETQYAVINQQCNVNGINEVVLDLLVINPQKYELLCKKSSDAPSSFSVVDENGVVAADIMEVNQISSDIIRVSMQLFDENEGKRLTLSGNLYPKNMPQLWEDSACSWSFIQNSPPDEFKNLDDSNSSTYEGKHFISFTVPEQTKKRNQDIVYEIACYDPETHSLINKARVSPSENKNNSEKEFHYYFDNQSEDIYYGYTVRVIDSTGLSTELFSTIDGLGIPQIVQPSISFNIQPNGFTDSDGYEYYEIPENQTFSYKIEKSNPADRIECKINGEFSSETKADLQEGSYDITIKTSRDGCYPEELKKKIKVVKELEEPNISFTGDYIESQDIYQFSYLSYNNMPYKITPKESGAKVNVKIDGTEVSNAADGNDSKLCVGNHVINITVEKENQKPKDVTVNLTVKIKPIKLGIGKGTTGYYTINPNNFGADSWDLKGQIYLNGVTVFYYEDGKKTVKEKQDNDITDPDYGKVIELNTIDSTISVLVIRLRRNKGVLKDIKFYGDLPYDCGTRTLKKIKEDGWTIDTGTLTDESGRQIQLKFFFDVSE